jgi:hypothetical protein
MYYAGSIDQIVLNLKRRARAWYLAGDDRPFP